MNYDIEKILVGGEITVSLPPGSTDSVLLAEAQSDIAGPVRRVTPNNRYPTDDELVSLYYSLKVKSDKIRSYLDRGLQVSVKYKNEKNEDVTAAFTGNSPEQLESLDEFVSCVRRWYLARAGTEAAMLKQMSSYDHPAMGRIPKSSAYSTPEVTNAVNEIVTAARRANEALLGDQEVSMQIGYMEFSEEELGPDNVFITEINDVSTISSLRSRTDIALKGSGGRSSIEVDIIFKDKDQINTKFRQLVGMLRMAPIIPLGGSAFSIAIINRITASKVFEKYKKHFYSQDSMAGRKIEQLVNEDLRENSDPSTGVTEQLLKDILKMDRSALEYMIKKGETSPAQDARTVTDNAGVREVNTEETIPESLRTLLVSVVFDSMSVSTIAAMPGAIRVRLVFMRHHDITSDTGELLFIDQDGNSTYDIRRCQPLKDSVEIVYLNPTRRKLTASVKNENEADTPAVNPDYISSIGDKTIVETLDKSVSGNLSGIDVSRVHTSDMGHNLYQDAISGGLSPVLFKFSTIKGMGSVIEYVPWRMVNSSVTWTMQNKIAMIPMEGRLMPAIQVMGKSGVTGTMTFMTDNREAVQEFSTVKASMDEISTSNNLGQLLRREFVDIYNDVLNLSGATRFIISSSTIQTSPDNPNLFMISIQFVSNEESIEKTEKLSVVQSSKSSVGELEELWWWLYGALVYNFEQARSIKPGTLINEYVNANNESTKYVSQVGQRIMKRPTTIRSSLSDSIASNKDTNLYTLEEIKLAVSMIKGFSIKNVDPILLEKSSILQSGLVERNMFVAAVTEMVRLQRIGEALKQEISYQNAADDGTITSNISVFIRDRIVKLSDICERGGDISSYDDDLDGPEMFKRVFNAIKRTYTGSDQYKDPMFIAKTNKGYHSNVTLEYLYWHIYTDMGGDPTGTGATSNFNENIPTETSDSKVAAQLTTPDYGLGYDWIPTPGMWQMLFNTMVAPGKFRTKKAGASSDYRGFPAGIHYPTTSLAANIPGVGMAQGPIYYISKVWQFNKARLNTILDSAESRRRLSSYFSDPRRAELYQQIGRAGFDLNKASQHNFLVDPEIFEKRNTYTDLGLPRYSEIFSVNRSDPELVPRKTTDGFEVWRKVAPTYAELGEPSNIFRSLTGLIHANGKFKFTHPALLTPRVFQDYCDPGFFYHKSTWINKSYSDVMDEIKLGTEENTRFMPAGPGGAFTPGWEEIYRMRMRHQDTKVPEIVLSEFDIRAVTQAQTAAQKDGVRTVKQLGETQTNRGKFSEELVKQIKDQLEGNYQNPQSGVPNFIESVRQNWSPENNRFLVIDAQGSRVGMLVVDKKGEQTGANSNINRVKTNSKGQNQIDIPITDSSKNSIFNGEEFKGKSITFIDMTDDFDKPADQKSYMSSTEMVKYNEYDKQESSAILKRTFEGIGDQKLNKARNYPAFRVYFVREKVTEQAESMQFMSDDIYGYASILSMDVMHDKEDASTAVITLTDISGVLSSSVFRRQIIKDDYSIENGKLKSKSDSVDTTKLDPNLNPAADSSDSDTAQKIILEVGTNIVVKMGYGQDPEFLRTVFTGAVAEIQPGDVTTIIAQSYRTEMFKYINFYGSNGLIDSMNLGSFSNVKNWTHPLFLVHHILVKMAKVSGVESALSFSGLPHFGRFMTMADFQGLNERDKQDFMHEYNKEANRTVPRGTEELTEQERAAGVNNDIDASNPGNLAKGAAYAGAAYVALSIATGPIGWVTLLGTAAAGAYGLYQNRYKRYVAKYDDFHVHTNAMRNVMISESFESHFWNYVSQEWIADGSGWSCLKEVARYKVNHICSEVPYGNHATLFMGKPDNLYHYKPLDKKSLEYYEQIAPAMSKFALDKLHESLLDPYLDSDDFDHYKSNSFGGHYDYQRSLDAIRIKDLLEKIVLLKESEKFDYVFKSRDFEYPEEFDSFAQASEIISASSSALFPPIGSKELQPAKQQKVNLGFNGNISPSLNESPLVVISGVKANLFLTDGIDPNTLIKTNKGFSKIFVTLFEDYSVVPLDRSEFEKLGYSQGDLVGFRLGRPNILARPELTAVSKSELTNIGVSTKSGLPLKDVYIYEFEKISRDWSKIPILPASQGDESTISQLKTMSSYGSQLSGIALYDSKGAGVIYSGAYKGVSTSTSGAKEINFDASGQAGLVFASEEPIIPIVGGGGIRVTLIKNRKKDLDDVEKMMKSTGKSLLRTIFAYFFGLDYRKLELGRVEISDGKNNSRGLNSLYGDVDGFAEEFTRALMEGTEFVERIESYRLTGSADPDLPNIDIIQGNERKLKIFNVKLERISRTYFEDRAQAIRNMGLTYGDLRAKSIKFDYNKAEKVFTDNLIESVEQGFLTQSEIQSYIRNAREILDIASRDLGDDKAGISTVEGAARSAISSSEMPGSNVRSQVIADNQEKFWEVVLNNANRYKLFIIYLAKFLRKNPDVAAQSVGISETLEWLSEGVPPDQKKFRDTHVVVSDYDIVFNNIIATTSQMYNNILLFGPSDVKVKQSSDSDDPNLSYYSVDEAQTSWVPFPNFQTTGVDFNPYVSPENRKQLQVRERNAETLDMKAALLINHLAEGMRPMYRGSIKIIGKHVKPYDLIYVADKFNHMFGFIEVERVVHNFSSTDGWTTTITPHAYVVPIDEVQMVARRFDTKWLEYMFLGIRVLDTALNVFALWSIVAAPLRAGFTSGLKAVTASAVDKAVAADFGKAIAADGVEKVVKNTLVNMIAGGLLRKEAFMTAFTTEARALLTAAGGTVTEAQVNKLAVQLLLKSSPDWMARGEVLSAIGTTLVNNLFSAKTLYLWLGRDMLFDGLSSYATISTQCQISSTTMPIHIFSLVKSSRAYTAGLDTKLSRFYNYSERLGYAMGEASAGFMNTMNSLFTLEDNVSTERNVRMDIAAEISNPPGG